MYQEFYKYFYYIGALHSIEGLASHLAAPGSILPILKKSFLMLLRKVDRGLIKLLEPKKIFPKDAQT